MRFEAYGWRVIRDVDGHDVEAVDAAMRAAHSGADRPTLICCKTIIGRGSPNKAGTEGVHGAALGAAEVAATREAIGWPYSPFTIPDSVYAGWDARTRGAQRESAWNTRFAAYGTAFPAQAAEFRRRIAGRLPHGFPCRGRSVDRTTECQATGSGHAQGIADAPRSTGGALPELLGGSADLTGVQPDPGQGNARGRPGRGGRYIHYGVREFGMAALMNGIALHGGFVPYGGTFLVFSDYARNALRMAALMRIRSIFVLTHDSIGLGEDGPTHQPIEHAASLRLIPNLDVWRPCDAVETAVAWTSAILREQGPTALLLSRQNIEPRQHSAAAIADIARGGYIHAEAANAPRAIVIATGSEVPLARAAQENLAAEGHRGQGRIDAGHPQYSTARPMDTAQRCCLRTCRVSRSRQASRGAGTGTRARWHRRRHRSLRRIRAGRCGLPGIGDQRRCGRRGIAPGCALIPRGDPGPAAMACDDLAGWADEASPPRTFMSPC